MKEYRLMLVIGLMFTVGVVHHRPLSLYQRIMRLKPISTKRMKQQTDSKGTSCIKKPQDSEENDDDDDDDDNNHNKGQGDLWGLIKGESKDDGDDQK